MSAQAAKVDSLDNSDEIIQLGYNYAKPADGVTSSFDVVNSEIITKSSALNPEESLYGRLAG